MDTHQAALKETLFGDGLEAGHSERSKRSCGGFKCALIAVMALIIVALGTCFVLYYFFFQPSLCKEAPPERGSAKVKVMCKRQEGNASGRHSIFTVGKAADYLIYGWVRFSTTVKGEKLRLVQNMDDEARTLDEKSLNQTEIFFFAKAKLVSNITISISFKSECVDSLFHIHEL